MIDVTEKTKNPSASNTKNYPPARHDKTFRQLMSHLPIAKEFLKSYLPAHILNKINLATLRITKNSYIDEQLRASASDVLYLAKTHDAKPAYIYTLCEHQSTPDKTMALRFLSYTCRIMQDHLRQKHQYLPIVIPLLVYNGKQTPYPYSMDVFDYFEDIAWAREVMLKPAYLVNLTAIPDDNILQQQNASAFFQMILKHSWQRDFLVTVEKCHKIIWHLNQTGQGDILKDLMQCVFLTTQISDNDALMAWIQPNPNDIGGNMATPAQQWYAEGMEKGIEKGIEKGMEKGKSYGKLQGIGQGIETVAKKMLAEDMALDLIVKVSGLSLDDIEKLKNTPL